ncbi:hypothetical protein OF83DRAFT_359543 [Amylostereum chailletii]|nr:hypothetical protein OF83DRAFT_359543 [Amylostereum chailletii]
MTCQQRTVYRECWVLHRLNMSHKWAIPAAVSNHPRTSYRMPCLPFHSAHQLLRSDTENVIHGGAIKLRRERCPAAPRGTCHKRCKLAHKKPPHAHSLDPVYSIGCLREFLWNL